MNSCVLEVLLVYVVFWVVLCITHNQSSDEPKPFNANKNVLLLVLFVTCVSTASICMMSEECAITTSYVICASCLVYIYILMFRKLI